MTDNPYVGPRPIADDLHPGERVWGRDREIAELADLVVANRIVLLYSPSGAGKTSLLRAGLIPRLAQRRFPARSLIRVGAPVPDAMKQHSPKNRYTLSVLLSLEEDAAEKAPAEQLARMTLAEYLKREERPRELLIFDQFEEVLTADPLDADGREAFFMQLGEALAVRSRWAIFSMREDIVAPLDRYLKYIPTRLSHTYRLDLLSKPAATEAVIGPAASRNVTFVPKAAAKLVENLSLVTVDDEDAAKTGEQMSVPGEYVEPVQLQVVCHRLWRTRKNAEMIGPDDVVDLDSVDDALAEYYADTVREAAIESKVPERAIRAWVGGSLITSRQPPTRRQVARTDEETAPVVNALKSLRSRYLIRSDRRMGQIWYELSHDRLIRPVLLNNECSIPELERRAATWNQKGRDEALLLGDADLKRLAPQYAEEVVAALPAAEIGPDAAGPCVSGSQGPSKLAKKFYEESRRRQTTRRVIRVLKSVAAIGAVAVAALAYTIYLDNERLEQREKELASVSLAREAERRREERLDLAMLLAVEAWKQAETPEAFATLYNLANSSPRLVRVLPHDALVLASVFLPNGSVAVALDGGGLALWSADGKLIASAPQRKSSWVTLAVSGDGRLAAGSADGRVCLLDPKTGEPIAEAPEPHQSAVSFLRFDPTGRLLASGEGDEMRLWMAGEKQLAMPGAGDGVPVRVNFYELFGQLRALKSSLASPLLSEIQDDIASRRVLPTSAGPGISAISPDGSREAVSEGRNIRITDRSGSGQAELTGYQNVAEGLTFSGDGNTLAAHPHFSRSVWLWDLRPPVPAEFAALDLFSKNWTVWMTSDAKGRQLAVMQEKATQKFILSYLNEARVASRTELSGEYSGSAKMTLVERGGRPLAIFSENSGRIHIRWADDLGRDLSTIDGGDVSAVDPNRDGTLLAVSGVGRPPIRLYSLADLSRPALLTADLAPGAHAQNYYGGVAAFSFARDVLAIGGPRITGNGPEDNAVVNLWDLKDPNHPVFLCMLTLDAKETTSLRFSPDGDTLASIDTTVKLWSVPKTPLTSAGKMLYPRATISAHSGVPGNIRFSPDSSLLAFGEHSPDWGSHIHLADALTGGLLGEPVDVGRPSQVMAFRENKLELWSYHTEKSDEMEGILGVPFEPRGWVSTLCRKANRNFSLEEWTMFVGDAAYEATCPQLPPAVSERKKRWWQFR